MPVSFDVNSQFPSFFSPPLKCFSSRHVSSGFCDLCNCYFALLISSFYHDFYNPCFCLFNRSEPGRSLFLYESDFHFPQQLFRGCRTERFSGFFLRTDVVYYLYCCTVHLVDSLIITQPTNALIVCHLF